ncbi:hypothetical protein K432DRAFT_407441 [Lepidopterella palustris CBS 459.81]|uniref:Uncharacterized protein n=1 Tax=Lepidopterella palustris CBS 459.81 TaxID=1314670 RepID=A0A8E2E4L5_9PEZI|nr:hypothetical protein K432DRAFT_407441 [Lepidopterella palustris CBS 459.81]
MRVSSALTTFLAVSAIDSAVTAARANRTTINPVYGDDTTITIPYHSSLSSPVAEVTIPLILSKWKHPAPHYVVHNNTRYHPTTLPNGTSFFPYPTPTRTLTTLTTVRSSAKPISGSEDDACM